MEEMTDELEKTHRTEVEELEKRYSGRIRRKVKHISAINIMAFVM